MNTITPIRILFNVVVVTSVLFIGFSPVIAQDVSANHDVRSCKATSKGIRCKNPIPSTPESSDILYLKDFLLKTEKICNASSRGTRCTQRQISFALMERTGDQHTFSKTEICRHTPRGSRCYS